MIKTRRFFAKYFLYYTKISEKKAISRAKIKTKKTKIKQNQIFFLVFY